MNTSVPGCTCPETWMGVVPPPCAVHNPPTATATGTTTGTGTTIPTWTQTPFMMHGWLCPRCQKVNAPLVTQCTCSPPIAILSPFYTGPSPLNPPWEVRCAPAPSLGKCETVTLTSSMLLGNYANEAA